MLVAGGLDVIDFSVNYVPLTLVAGLNLIGTAIVNVLALVRQQGSRLSSRLRALTWASAGYLALSYLIGYVLFIVLNASRSGPPAPPWEMIRRATELSPDDSAAVWWLSLFGIVGALSLGGLGLLWARNELNGSATGLDGEDREVLT
jgi:hypothetical protein